MRAAYRRRIGPGHVFAGGATVTNIQLPGPPARLTAPTLHAVAEPKPSPVAAWLLLVLGVVLAVCSVSGLWSSARDLRTLVAGIEGSVAVEDCHRYRGGWECVGDFTAYDGSVEPHKVSVRVPGWTRPADAVRARIGAPDDGVALAPGAWYETALTMLVTFAFGAITVDAFRRWRKERRKLRLPQDARPPKPVRPPWTGARRGKYKT